MKCRLAIFVFAWALLAGWDAACASSPSERLTSLAAIHALSNAQADQSIPVAFEGTVTYYKKGDVDLFVQDGDIAIYVEATRNAGLKLGDRVLVRGTTRGSFRPEIKSDSVTVLRHGDAPKAVAATFTQLMHAELDCRRVSVRAVVRSANNIMDDGVRSLYLQLLMDGGNLDAEVLYNEAIDTSQLLDAEVEVTGAVAGKFDSKNQMTGVLLEVQSIADLKILKAPGAPPNALPVTPIDEILKGYDVQDRTKRVRIEGSITYYQPGSALVLENGSRSLWVSTQFEEPLQTGQWASVTGFPDVRNGSLTLTRAAIHPTGIPSPVPALSTSAQELTTGTHAYDLVSVEGRLLTAVREEAQDEYVLVSDGHLFSAVYRHPERGLNVAPPPMPEIPLGSAVRVTGICILDNGYKFQGLAAFEVLLRSPADTAVMAPPPALSVRNLIALVGVLVVVILGLGARAWLIERRTRRQIALLARIEQRRSRILEHINGSYPLPGILEEITSLVSFKMSGAPCWCTTADGGRYGNQPPLFGGLRIVETEIPARLGPSLGSISAAFDARINPDEEEQKTLDLAAGLAALAIETRRLYSDLTHRSEFDQLTDVHNRFSLETRLDAVIEQNQTGFFGLIYIDLDGFKLINDIYGHRVGDIYLQKAAMRMQRQVRPADMFARIGGDEFAVLVSTAATEDEVREIALRLSKCFDSPFEVDRHIVHGAASFGIACYPKNGITRDSLLNAADADMYTAKRAKRRKSLTSHIATA